MLQTTTAKDDLRILVVDDEDVVRQSLERWFTEDGCQVRTASDAAQALRELQVGQFDLALVDVKMPGMDGLELQRRLSEIDPSLTVIMITAYGVVPGPPQQRVGELLAELDARLVERIHTVEFARVRSGQLEHHEDPSDVPWIDPLDRERHAGAPVPCQRRR